MNNPADALIFSKTGKFSTVTPLKVIRAPKDQYDKMEQGFFERKLNELNKPQKQVNLEKHLQHFETF